LVVLAAAIGCSGDDAPNPDMMGATDNRGPTFGTCTYVNGFSMSEECRQYRGIAWNEANVTEDCNIWGGVLQSGGECSYDMTLGICELFVGTDLNVDLHFPGTGVDQCEDTQRGCEVFAGGTFRPAPVCDNGTTSGGGGVSVFVPPELVCQEPLSGEPVGLSDGQVCTQGMISGCTEPGRRYRDYGSCDAVLTQRPYFPVPPAPVETDPNDPRRTDAEYLAELDWVKSEVEACACVCCHSDDIPPDGPSNWFIEAEEFWVDSFYPSGLAFVAGWTDSSSFGAYPPEENNGFDRTQVGLPSSDPARMQAFFEGELTRRGFTRADFADEPPEGGPLYTQRIYEPEDCEAGIGVDAEGNVNWAGGGARYVYVLEEGSESPTVPPNLDLPEGTLWRIDVPPTAMPIESPVAYGVVPEGSSQRFPADDGTPKTLVSGNRYYLYVLADILLPVTRCVFTAP
ncbi:MAG: proteinase inhibitor, partial [Myxococcota bacterium]